MKKLLLVIILLLSLPSGGKEAIGEVPKNPVLTSDQICCIHEIEVAIKVKNANIETWNKALDIITQYEGFSKYPYRCPAGYKTIGHGFLYDRTIHGDSITMWKSKKLLLETIKELDHSIQELVDKELTPNRRASLISFTYNVGFYAFKRSSLLKKINLDASDEDIREELNRWVHIRKNGHKIILRGLTLRRAEESFCWSQTI